ATVMPNTRARGTRQPSTSVTAAKTELTTTPVKKTKPKNISGPTGSTLLPGGTSRSHAALHIAIALVDAATINPAIAHQNQARFKYCPGAGSSFVRGAYEISVIFDEWFWA